MKIFKILILLILLGSVFLQNNQNPGASNVGGDTSAGAIGAANAGGGGGGTGGGGAAGAGASVSGGALSGGGSEAGGGSGAPSGGSETGNQSNATAPEASNATSGNQTVPAAANETGAANQTNETAGNQTEANQTGSSEKVVQDLDAFSTSLNSYFVSNETGEQFLTTLIALQNDSASLGQIGKSLASGDQANSSQFTQLFQNFQSTDNNLFNTIDKSLAANWKSKNLAQCYVEWSSDEFRIYTGWVQLRNLVYGTQQGENSTDIQSFCQNETDLSAAVDGLFSLIDGSSDCDIFNLWNDGNEVTNIYYGFRDSAFNHAGFIFFYALQGIEVLSACNQTGDGNYSQRVVNQVDRFLEYNDTWTQNITSYVQQTLDQVLRENPDLTPQVVVLNTNFTLTNDWPFYAWSSLALYQNASQDSWYSNCTNCVTLSQDGYNYVAAWGPLQNQNQSNNSGGAAGGGGAVAPSNESAGGGNASNETTGGNSSGGAAGGANESSGGNATNETSGGATGGSNETSGGNASETGQNQTTNETSGGGEAAAVVASQPLDLSTYVDSQASIAEIGANITQQLANCSSSLVWIVNAGTPYAVINGFGNLLQQASGSARDIFVFCNPQA